MECGIAEADLHSNLKVVHAPQPAAIYSRQRPNTPIVGRDVCLPTGQDTYAESGSPEDLMKKYGLLVDNIVTGKNASRAANKAL